VLVEKKPAVRAWEIKREGVTWLKDHGVERHDQDMSRNYFDYLRIMGWAYIYGSAPKSPQVIVHKPPVPSQPAPTNAAPQCVAAIVVRAADTSPRSNKAQNPSVIPAPSKREVIRPADLKPVDNQSSPPHWERRTVKKDWFT